MEAALVIYATAESDAQSTPALGEALSRVRAVGGEVRETENPAAFGELAGVAIEILVSDPSQAFTNAVQIGAVLWAVIRGAKAAGRRIRVGKPASTPLAASDLARRLEQEPSDEATGNVEPMVWGPMRAELVAGFPDDLFATDGATEDCMYFVALVLPWRRERARTYWYLITNSGHVASSWHTQTFLERLPDFLRPG